MSELMLEHTAAGHTYSRGANLLCDAAQGFGIEVSDEQTDHWRLVFTAMHELDAILDGKEPYKDRGSQYGEMIEVIMGDVGHVCRSCYACDLQAHMTKLPPGRQETFKTNAEIVKVLGEE